MRKRFAFKNLLTMNKKGFTLIELLLYMGIFSTLLMVLVQLFGSIVNMNLDSQANAAISQDGRYILNEMSYSLRQASTYTTPSDVGAANQSSQLQFTTSGNTTYSYALSNDPVGQQNVIVTATNASGSTTERLNSFGTTVSNLHFVRLKSTTTTGTPKQTITVSFTLTSIAQETKGPKVEVFQTTIGGR